RKCLDRVVVMSRRIHARRLDGVDKNIWIEFTQLAADYKAVNLGQGFPDFAPPKFIQDAFCEAVGGGCLMHQYTRAFTSPLDDVLVTVGAYQALFCAFQALVDEGDERVSGSNPSSGDWVLSAEELASKFTAKTKLIVINTPNNPIGKRVSGSNPSSGDWVLSAEELASKFTAKTKLIVINTPNNPIGKVFKREELQVIADLCVRHNVVCI
ncbi:hypothetical protein CRUP_007850, partial [Coryphaenoides rupestris]